MTRISILLEYIFPSHLSADEALAQIQRQYPYFKVDTDYPPVPLEASEAPTAQPLDGQQILLFRGEILPLDKARLLSSPSVVNIWGDPPIETTT